MENEADTLIRKHYRKQAEKDGISPLSTIGEQVVRNKEVELIKCFLNMVRQKTLVADIRVLDAGCGNGYTLDALRKDNPMYRLYGLEFTEELLELARSRNIERCVLDHADIRAAPYDALYFDAIYTERCLINILDIDQQERAIREIARLLKPSGHYLMIECFNDGLENNNNARMEMGLEKLCPAYHNLYFDKEVLFSRISDIFQVVDQAEATSCSLQSNFLSSHYFVARILHPLLTRGEWIPNTEFVSFFSFLPPVGNYAPVKAYVLRKIMDSAG